METSRVTTKGQVAISQKIRDRLDIHAGDVLAFFSAEDDTLRVQKLNLLDVEGAQGRLRAKRPPKTLPRRMSAAWPARSGRSSGQNGTRIPRILNNAGIVGYQCRGCGFGICVRTDGEGPL